MALRFLLLSLAAAGSSAHAVRRADPVPATNPVDSSSTLNGIAAPSDSFDSYCSHVPFPEVPKLPQHARGLTLAHLQVAIRHGARSSVRECPRILGLDRLECSMAHTLSAPVLDDPDTAAPAGTNGGATAATVANANALFPRLYRKVYTGLGGPYAPFVNADSGKPESMGCKSGRLLPEAHQQLARLGAMLRKTYVDVGGRAGGDTSKSMKSKKSKSSSSSASSSSRGRQSAFLSPALIEEGGADGAGGAGGEGGAGGTGTFLLYADDVERVLASGQLLVDSMFPPTTAQQQQQKQTTHASSSGGGGGGGGGGSGGGSKTTLWHTSERSLYSSCEEGSVALAAAHKSSPEAKRLWAGMTGDPSFAAIVKVFAGHAVTAENAFFDCLWVSMCSQVRERRREKTETERQREKRVCLLTPNTFCCLSPHSSSSSTLRYV